MALTRSELLSNIAATVAKLPIEALTIPELGGTIYVRGLSARERGVVIERARLTRGPQRGDADSTRLQSEMLLLCVCQQDGSSFLEPGDVDVLCGLPAGVIDRIMGVMNRLSGFGAEVEADLGNGSASPTGNGASSSSSRVN